MYLTQSLQHFQQNINIQKKIGESWGYNLDNSSYKFPKVYNQRHQGIKINSTITPLKIQKKFLEESTRLKQINYQIKQMEIMKKINIKKKIQGKQFNVIKLVNQMVRQYNNFVDHKNFVLNKPDKYSERRERRQDSNQINSVLKQIKEKQNQLLKPGDLLAKFNRNKQMTQLYKQFANSTNIKLKKTKSIESPPPKKRQKTNPSFSENKNYSTIKNQIASWLPCSSVNQQQINIQNPFVSKKFLQKSYEINQQIQRNKHIEQLMREKINKFETTFTSMHSQIKNTQIKSQHNQLSPSIKPQQSIHTQFKINLNFSQNRRQQQMQMIQKKYSGLTHQQKKIYLTSAIKKRSPKYIKMQGGKFVKKFNYKQIARQMIDGKQPSHKKIIDQSLKIEKLHNKVYTIPDNLNEQDKMVINLMNEQQSTKNQWSNSLSQKMNLLMKSKRKPT